jgi:hypothetical protein
VNDEVKGILDRLFELDEADTVFREQRRLVYGRELEAFDKRLIERKALHKKLYSLAP